MAGLRFCSVILHWHLVNTIRCRLTKDIWDMVGLLISEPTWKQSYLDNIYPWIKLKRPTPKWIESILASWGPEARLNPIYTCEKISTARQISGTVRRLPVPRPPPGGSLGTPKILSTGATLHLGPIRLHVENCECRAFKSSAQCQKFGLPCRLFSACRRGLRDSTCVNCWQNVWKNSVCFSSLISEPAPISPSSPLLWLNLACEHPIPKTRQIEQN